MYNRQVINEEIVKVFENLKRRSHSFVSRSSDLSVAHRKIMGFVASEVRVYGTALITDMYDKMSKATLSSTAFENAESRSCFYDANILDEMMSKFKFDISAYDATRGGIQFKQLDRLSTSLAAGAGAAAAGYGLTYAIVTAINIPILVVIAVALTACGTSYYRVIPALNRSAFQKATDKYLLGVKAGFTAQLDEAEEYYKQRIESLVKEIREALE